MRCNRKKKPTTVEEKQRRSHFALRSANFSFFCSQLTFWPGRGSFVPARGPLEEAVSSHTHSHTEAAHSRWLLNRNAFSVSFYSVPSVSDVLHLCVKPLCTSTYFFLFFRLPLLDTQKNETWTLFRGKIDEKSFEIDQKCCKITENMLFCRTKTFLIFFGPY